MQHVRRRVASYVLPRRGRVPRDVGAADGAGALGRASRSSTSGLAAALRRGARLRLLPQHVERRDHVGSALCLTFVYLLSCLDVRALVTLAGIEPVGTAVGLGPVGPPPVLPNRPGPSAETHSSGSDRGCSPGLPAPLTPPQRIERERKRCLRDPSNRAPASPDSSWGSAATRHDTQPSCAGPNP